MGSTVWNEMSFRRYANRLSEREMDLDEELRAEENLDCELFNNTIYYGTIQDLYADTTFGVEDLFYLTDEE